MTRSATRPLDHALIVVGLGLFVMISLLLTAAPAGAKQDTRKPHKLWSQYPLNVKGPTPSPTASKAASQQTAPTPSVTTPRPSSDRTHRRSANAGTTGRKLLVFGGAAILLAALVLLVKRVKPRNATDNGRERAITQPDPHAASATNHAGNGYNRSVIETTSEPWMGAAPARVRLQLEDGRSLEGFTRESGSADSELVILDVIATFDHNGKEAPPRPSDSFILRSEIASMHRIKDS
jgi:hypothetical protein